MLPSTSSSPGESGHHQLIRTGGAWQLRFAPARQPALLSAIAQSAAATLAEPLIYVRRCAEVPGLGPLAPRVHQRRVDVGIAAAPGSRANEVEHPLVGRRGAEVVGTAVHWRAKILGWSPGIPAVFALGNPDI